MTDDEETDMPEQTVYVAADGDDTADGAGEDTPMATLAAAVAALDGPGVVSVAGTITTAESVDLPVGVTLRGSTPDATVVYTGTKALLAPTSGEHGCHVPIEDLIVEAPNV